MNHLVVAAANLSFDDMNAETHEPYTQDITIVLLCSGNGSDAKSYRPNRDDSQWWGRRDALVRCVSAALFSQDYRSESGTTKSHIDGGIKLILLFDGDGSMMCMNRIFTNNDTKGNRTTPNPQSSTTRTINNATEQDLFIPTEHNLISMWRDACNSSSRKKKDHSTRSGTILFGRNSPKNAKIITSSLSCKLLHLPNKRNDNVSVSQTVTKRSKGQSQPKLNDLKALNSKREVLNHIQSNCAFEFLKSMRLNASTEVILKKTNKPKLVNAWMEWCNYCKQNGGENNDTADLKYSKRNKRTEDNSISKDVFHSIISNEIFPSSSSQDFSTGNKHMKRKRKHGEKSNDTHNPEIIVSFLHESCACELPVSSPCGKQMQHLEKNRTPKKVILFMGAVRDMTENENKNLAFVCKSLNIPLVGCRLGPVAEFTSKILQILTVHVAKKKLKPALLKLHQNQNQSVDITTPTKKKKEWTNISNGDVKSVKRIGKCPLIKDVTNRLHVIVTLDLPSSALTSSLSERSYVMWTIVRLTVCTLWRSRVASSRQSKTNLETDSISHTANAAACDLENVLTFSFNDGLFLTIEQNALVDMLAKKHQAAPSEYQILEALCALRDKSVRSRSLTKSQNNDIDRWNETAFSDLLEDEKGRLSKTSSFIYALKLEEVNSNSNCIDQHGLLDMFYSEYKKDECRNDPCSGTILAIFTVKSPHSGTQKESEGDSCKSLEATLSREGIPLLQDSLVLNSMVDYASTSVTMLQHLIYQEEALFGLMKKKYNLYLKI